MLLVAAIGGVTSPASAARSGHHDVFAVNPRTLPESGGTVTLSLTGVGSSDTGCAIHIGGSGAGLVSAVVATQENGIHTSTILAGNRGDYPIVSSGQACPATLTATATVRADPRVPRTTIGFRVTLDKAHKGHPVAFRSGWKEVGVAGRPRAAIDQFRVTPAAQYAANGSAGPTFAIRAVVANATTCAVSARVVLATGSLGGGSVADLAAFDDVRPRAMPCSAAAAPTSVPGTNLVLPAIDLARHATCAIVRVKVTLTASGDRSTPAVPASQDVTVTTRGAPLGPGHPAPCPPGAVHRE